MSEVIKFFDKIRSLNLLSKFEKSIYNKIQPPKLLICLDLPCKLAYSRHTDGNEDLEPKYNAIQRLLRKIMEI